MGATSKGLGRMKQPPHGAAQLDLQPAGASPTIKISNPEFSGLLLPMHLTPLLAFGPVASPCGPFFSYRLSPLP